MGQGICGRLRQASCLAALMLAVACSPIVRNHGYVPEPEDLARIVIGQDTPDSVRQIVGPPTAGGVLDETGFYYVQSRFEQLGLFAPEEVTREVVAIRFGPGGTVSNIERFGLEAGRVVVLSRRVTDDNIADMTLIRQLLGNLGRVDAADLIGEN